MHKMYRFQTGQTVIRKSDRDMYFITRKSMRSASSLMEPELVVAVHRRASRTAQFRKVCRSKNSNGRPIAAVK